MKVPIPVGITVYLLTWGLVLSFLACKFKKNIGLRTPPPLWRITGSAQVGYTMCDGAGSGEGRQGDNMHDMLGTAPPSISFFAGGGGSRPPLLPPVLAALPAHECRPFLSMLHWFFSLPHQQSIPPTKWTPISSRWPIYIAYLDVYSCTVCSAFSWVFEFDWVDDYTLSHIRPSLGRERRPYT